MLPDPSVLLWILTIALVPLLAAGLLLRRGKLVWGFLLGLILVALMEFYFFWDMNSESQACIQRACLEAGRPRDCEPVFGCTEGNGMASLLYMAAGVADLILLVTATLAIFLRRRETQNRTDSTTPS